MSDFTLILMLWIVPIPVAWAIGDNRGRGGAGALLGFFLGWIGVLAALFLPEARRRTR